MEKITALNSIIYSVLGIILFLQGQKFEGLVLIGLANLMMGQIKK